MKQAALQALQHIRTTLAYQLTPEVIEELVGPLDEYLQQIGTKISRTAMLHNAKVDGALLALHSDDFSWSELEEAIRSLRL